MKANTAVVAHETIVTKGAKLSASETARGTASVGPSSPRPPSTSGGSTGTAAHAGSSAHVGATAQLGAQAPAGTSAGPSPIGVHVVDTGTIHGAATASTPTSVSTQTIAHAGVAAHGIAQGSAGASTGSPSVVAHAADAVAGKTSIGLNAAGAVAGKTSTGIHAAGGTTIHGVTHIASMPVGTQAAGQGSVAVSATGSLSSGAKSVTATSVSKIGWAAKVGAIAAKGSLAAKVVAVASVGVAGLIIAAHTGAAPGVETALSAVPVWSHGHSLLSQVQAGIQGGASGGLNL